MVSGQGELPTSPAQVPDDILYYNILPRLPYRSLKRFASVCKAWRELILRDADFAALQAQSPTRASAALAHFHKGRFEVVSAGAGPIAPLDPCISMPPIGEDQRLEFCACTNGLLCLTAEPPPRDRPRTFFITNPAWRKYHSFEYSGPRGVVGLAYDPVADGYDLVAAAMHGIGLLGFSWFSSRAARSGWRQSQRNVRLAVSEYEVIPKPAYAGGRVHWLTNRGGVVWYDVAGDLCGRVEPPSERPIASGCRLEGNWDLGAWRGRIRLSCASSHAGLGVWALASYGAGRASPARWELVHWRSWSRIPGVVNPRRCFLWSVVPAGLEPGEDEALGLALWTAHMSIVEGKEVQVWRRALVRCDPCTGATETAVALGGKEVHDDLGTVFGYHSSMAALPELNWAA